MSSGSQAAKIILVQKCDKAVLLHQLVDSDSRVYLRSRQFATFHDTRRTFKGVDPEGNNRKRRRERGFFKVSALSGDA